MIKRIEDNEKILDNVSDVIKNLEISLDEFEKIEDDLTKLNNYYGSKNWFKDKEMLEKRKIKNIKAGVLSEDAVWNLLEKRNELIERMKKIIQKDR